MSQQLEYCSNVFCIDVTFYFVCSFNTAFQAQLPQLNMKRIILVTTVFHIVCIILSLVTVFQCNRPLHLKLLYLLHLSCMLVAILLAILLQYYCISSLLLHLVM